jgi:hypothetical protein
MNKTIAMVLCHLLVLLWAQCGDAARTMTIKIGRGEVAVAHLEGSAQVLSEGKVAPSALKVNDLLKKGDEISTGPKAKLELVMPDKSQLRFADNSRFRLVQMDAGEEQARDVKVHVAIGKAWADLRKCRCRCPRYRLSDECQRR